MNSSKTQDIVLGENVSTVISVSSGRPPQDTSWNTVAYVFFIFVKEMQLSPGTPGKLGMPMATSLIYFVKKTLIMLAKGKSARWL